MKTEMKKELLGSFAFAGVMLVLAFCAKLAQRQGYVEQDTITRLLTGIMGLWMVWYGNRLPKTVILKPHCAHRARRISSWSLVLSGLVYAGLWAFAPIPVAVWGGMGAVLAGAAVTLGYCLSLRSKAV